MSPVTLSEAVEREESNARRLTKVLFRNPAVLMMLLRVTSVSVMTFLIIELRLVNSMINQSLCVYRLNHRAASTRRE